MKACFSAFLSGQGFQGSAWAISAIYDRRFLWLRAGSAGFERRAAECAPCQGGQHRQGRARTPLRVGNGSHPERPAWEILHPLALANRRTGLHVSEVGVCKHQKNAEFF